MFDNLDGKFFQCIGIYFYQLFNIVLDRLFFLYSLFMFCLYIFIEEKDSEKMIFKYFVLYVDFVCDSDEKVKYIKDIIMKKIDV